MLDSNYYYKIYQQWSDGQTDITSRWMDFVKLVSRKSGKTQTQVMDDLKKCKWFKWR